MRDYSPGMNEHPEIWQPLEGLPDGAEDWGNPQCRVLERQWLEARSKTKAGDPADRFIEAWLAERNRAFAVETGQIEGLYTLKRGVTEQLVAEGFAGVVGAHTLENLADRVIAGLLKDQTAACEMLWQDVAERRPLTASMLKSWHALLTRHQETVTGLNIIDGRIRKVRVPFVRKGVWKIASNNPRRPDGVVHQYCPPEHVEAEMDRFFVIYNEEVAPRPYPVEVEAAWLHHRFVRTHPFQDGNGRVSRLLMAYAYVRRNLPSPIVTAEEKPAYIDLLEAADSGDLRVLVDGIAVLALRQLHGAQRIAQRALSGKLNRPTGNGGRRVGDDYLPPCNGEPDLEELAR
ncbi:MAG: Fic family protein [Gammaproteobacteria bacterium]|nr:Fic family protein [Gammaproteobacteria bacterium]MYF28297.1 Fic family protein [Gammaproteobacteria bacterium]